MNSLPAPSVSVQLKERHYPIYIGYDLLRQAAYFEKAIHGKQVVIISNPVITKHYLPAMQSWLSQYEHHIINIPAGESYKTLDECEKIWSTLLEKNYLRSTTLIALGGGVIGDLTGFAAACYQRGAGFIQVPTSLLADVDASVGGKTAVNHPLGKNMIGAFYQPHAVIIDIKTLNTLPKQHFHAGLAEVIKTALLFDASFFTWIEEHIDALLGLEETYLIEMIARCCQFKAKIVAKDERESGQRALLNLGHTYGHALEQCLGYENILHGEAVAIGLLLACHYSEKYQQLDPAIRCRVQTLLVKCKLPIALPSSIDLDAILKAMARDKKNQHQGIRLILLRKIGQGMIYDSADPQNIKSQLEQYRPI